MALVGIELETIVSEPDALTTLRYSQTKTPKLAADYRLNNHYQLRGQTCGK